MVKILENYDLTKLNTFGVSAKARYFAEVVSEESAGELFKNRIFRKNKRLFLGSGSNVLFTRDFAGIVVLNKLKGMEVLKEDSEKVRLKAMSGESWSELVDFCADRRWWGIENLALIPGTVGAAPIQNIGAYGAELKNVLVQLEAYDLNTGEKKIFKNKECNFGYRSSIFKKKLKGRYFILSVLLELKKSSKANTAYRVLSEYLKENNIIIRGPKDINAAVSAIRRSKLPDPKKIGNAGSFFKNVLISEAKLARLQKKFPAMPHFREEKAVKIPAGWLIEQCGWRGKNFGRAGVHEKQALVLVNLGGASGMEIKKLSDRIKNSVRKKFGLLLETEVNIC